MDDYIDAMDFSNIPFDDAIVSGENIAIGFENDDEEEEEHDLENVAGGRSSGHWREGGYMPMSTIWRKLESKVGRCQCNTGTSHHGWPGRLLARNGTILN
jgi:hypothetical protein